MCIRDSVALVCNEEGKLEGLPLNRALRDEDGDIYDVVAGTFLVVGLTDDSFGSLTVEQMLIDGYIIVVDYTEQKKLAAEINKIGVNINTVCRRINSTGRFYQDDIDELKEKMDAVWQLLKSKQSEEL